MSNDKLPSYFVEDYPIPFGTDPELFSWFFETEEFKQWHRQGRSWQLRCCGEPGSGKTTLSALTIAHLKDTYHGRNSAVAAVFFQRPVQDMHDQLVKQFLKSVLRQLSTVTPTSNDMTMDTQDKIKSLDETIIDKHSVDPLRQTLYERIQQCDRALLVVDDLDLCSRAATLKIEIELSNLQLHGLSIMVTSRLPHKHHSNTACCDMVLDDVSHDYADISIYWSCKGCFGEGDDFTSSNPYLLCQSCVDNNQVCRDCGQLTNLYEPYQHVDYFLSAREDSMQRFIAREIELTHGDVGLNSYPSDAKHMIPPQSTLGRLLIPSVTSHPALDLQNRIISLASGNVTLAKLRLETVESAQTISDLFRMGDRLPDNILAIFDAGISRISQQPESQRKLGLRAIVRAASNYAGVAYEELKRDLQREATFDPLPSISEADISYEIEDMLHAAGGFLVSDMGKDAIISTYDKTFYKYVLEDYNENLFWIKSEAKIGGFSRSSTIDIRNGSLSKPLARNSYRGPPKMRMGKRPDFGLAGASADKVAAAAAARLGLKSAAQMLNMKVKSPSLDSKGDSGLKTKSSKKPNMAETFHLARRPTSHI